ncbi:MAG: UDP-N-acetylmuramoyl-L-alanine--D-glutamate ligase [Pseudomonadota bacterium]
MAGASSDRSVLDNHRHPGFDWTVDVEDTLMDNLDLHKRYLVVGMGLTGQSVARHLQRQGASFTMVDSRPQPPGFDPEEFAQAQFHTGSFPIEVFLACDVLVVSPGISVHQPEIEAAVAAGAELAGDIELFAQAMAAQQSSTPIIGVTGSNGKSTVVSMLGAIMLSAGVNTAVGGNLGTPALDLLHQQPDADLYVLELSSFQLETTRSLRPTAAAVLNISEDHMDRYAALNDYAAAKRRIYINAERCVFNALQPITAPEHGLGVAFSMEPTEGARYIASPTHLERDGEKLVPRAALRVPGYHNIENALAAVALAAALPNAIAPDQAALFEGLASFAGLPHRTQWVAHENGVDWYNDSKGTNVGATLAAIEGLARPSILIAGGDGKGADFSPLADAASRHVRAAVLIGRDAPLIASALAEVTQIHRADSMQAAVEQAKTLAQTGDAVLLSPACASFDMYTSYVRRGEDFMAAVERVLA